MSNIGTVEIGARELMAKATITVRLRGYRAWRLRAWFGVRLMKLGAWLIGAHFEVES